MQLITREILSLILTAGLGFNNDQPDSVPSIGCLNQLFFSTVFKYLNIH